MARIHALRGLTSSASANSFGIMLAGVLVLALGTGLLRAGIGVPLSASAPVQFLVLHSFDGAGEGACPCYLLQSSVDGNFYGVTTGSGSAGGAKFFTLTAGGAFTVLHHFDVATDGVGGAPLAEGGDGNFYGSVQHQHFSRDTDRNGHHCAHVYRRSIYASSVAVGQGAGWKSVRDHGEFQQPVRRRHSVQDDTGRCRHDTEIIWTRYRHTWSADRRV